ncbi:Fe-S protein [Vibrio tubiashii]|nr:Fe-S protein [Vibrio tubiashii]
MEQLEFFTVQSPCVGVCTVDEKGYCKGCMRKREERFNWLDMSTAQQLHVIKLCRQRYLRKIRKGKLASDEDKLASSPQQDLF